MAEGRAGADIWEALRHDVSRIERRPRLVADVEAAFFTTRAGAPYVVIRNPAANTYMRLEPREHALLDLMDGTRSIKELVAEYYRRHGVLALPRITALVADLRARYFLTEPPIDAYGEIASRLRPRDAGRWATRVLRGLVQTEMPLPGLESHLHGWYTTWGHRLFIQAWLWAGVGLGVLGALLIVFEMGRGRYHLSSSGRRPSSACSYSSCCG